MPTISVYTWLDYQRGSNSFKGIYDVETLSALLDISELNFIQYFIVQIGYLLSEFTNSELVYVGYLIPGLIASWMDKQGILTLHQ